MVSKKDGDKCGVPEVGERLYSTSSRHFRAMDAARVRFTALILRSNCSTSVLSYSDSIPGAWQSPCSNDPFRSAKVHRQDGDLDRELCSVSCAVTRFPSTK